MGARQPFPPSCEDCQPGLLSIRFQERNSGNFQNCCLQCLRAWEVKWRESVRAEASLQKTRCLPTTMPTVSRYQLCCGCMPIFSGIFAIVFHSFLHSVYGICIILTSYYTVQDDLVNYVALASYVCLLIIGGKRSSPRPLEDRAFKPFSRFQSLSSGSSLANIYPGSDSWAPCWSS